MLHSDSVSCSVSNDNVQLNFYDKLPIWSELPAPKVNPLVNDTTKQSSYEKFKFYFACVTLIPIRIVLILFVSIFIAFFSFSSILGADLTKPLPRWRRALQLPIKFFGRGLLFAMGYYWIPTKGTPGSFSQAPLIICNHICFIEPIFFYQAVLPCGVSRSEQKKVPILGTLFKALQMIFVDRRNPNSRHDTAEEIINRSRSNCPAGFVIPEDLPTPPVSPTASFVSPKSAARDKPIKSNNEKSPLVENQNHSSLYNFFFARKWPQVLLFPEGTCTNGKALIQFKVGAFSPAVPVQPCVVKYDWKNNDPTWVYAGPGGDVLFWRTLSQFVNHMSVEYLPIYSPSREEQLNPKLFANNVRQVMANALGVKTTDHNWDDVVLAGEAIKLGLPCRELNVECYHICKRMEIKQESVHRYLEMFANLDKVKSGYLSRSDFNELLTCRNPRLTDALWREFDYNLSGKISFREFLIAAAVMNKNSGATSVSLAAKLLYNVLTISGTITLKTEVITNMSLLQISDDEKRSKLFNQLKNNTVQMEEFVNLISSDPHLEGLEDFVKACNLKMIPSEKAKKRNDDE